MATLGSPSGGALTAANAATGDKFPVVDVSVGASDSANKTMTTLETAALMARIRPDFSGFKTPPLVADYTVVQAVSGTFTQTDTATGLLMAMTGRSGDWASKHLVKTMPATPFTMTAEIEPAFVSLEEYCFGGIGLRESATAKIMTLHMMSRANQILSAWAQKFTSPDLSSADGGFFTPISGFSGRCRFLRLTVTSTTLQALISADGVNWYTYSTVTWTNFFTTGPDQVTLSVGINNGTTKLSHWLFRDVYFT